MKITDHQIDPKVLEEGDWVDDIPEMGNLRLKVRGIGNKDWARMQRRLQDAIPRRKRPGGRIDQEEQDRITSVLLRDACLIDWDNMEDGDGKPIPYSKEFAAKICSDPQYVNIRNAVIWAATVVTEQRNEDVEDIAKN